MQELGVKMAHWRTEDIPTFTLTFGDMKLFSDNQYLCIHLIFSTPALQSSAQQFRGLPMQT
jgi:hypothetical protein